MKGLEGQTLGRYELRRRIAQGGMAEVYLGYDKRVRRQVAVKVLYGRDEPFVRRFEREALAVGALSHNHILPLYDFGEQSPWYYLVMPYVEGSTLRDYLLKRHHLTLEEVASILNQIASALQYAHNHGVVHRDVKPSNILLRPDGYAYLVDFGLAKALLDSETLTSAGAMIGTPEYMAPEQSNGLSDYRSDIYSLGIILYQMLTGRVPFIAESPVAVSLKHIQSTPVAPRNLNSEIPQAVEDVILKAMAKDPNVRYQEAMDLANAYWKALQQWQGQQEEEQHLPTPQITAESTGEGSLENKTTSTATRVLKEPNLPVPLLFPLVEEAGSALAKPNSTSFPSFRRRTSLRTRVIFVCLFLFILALPLGLLTWQAQQDHRHIADSSEQALDGQQLGAGMTATARAQAQAEATLAAQARAQATAGITSSIGAGKILYANDLTGPGGGWINDGNQCYFTPQGYHVQTHSPHEVAWCYSSAQSFGNAVILAQARLLRGDVYGLVFRLSPFTREFYVLEINSQGAYRFIQAAGSNPTNWLTLIDWTRSSAIQPGYGTINTFLVVATGSNFRFYINRQLIVTSFTNNTYASGLLGFLVGDDSAGGTEAVFSNIFVFQR